MFFLDFHINIYLKQLNTKQLKKWKGKTTKKNN